MPDGGKTTSIAMPPTLKLGWLDRRFPMIRLDRLEFLTAQSELGDITHFRAGPFTVYFINHPDLIRDVLVVNADKFIKGRALQRSKTMLGMGLLTSEKEFHLRQRRMIQPAFHRTRIAEYTRAMTHFSDAMAETWRDGETLDIDREMMRLTLQIVAKTLFDTDVTKDADDVGRSLTTLVEMFNLLLLPYSEILEKLPFPQSIKLKKARKTLDRIIYGMIDERRASGEDKGDLLSMLLAARDEDDGGQMTNEQVRDEALTLFLAGHETTANALTWTWYLLSQNPEAEAKFHAEIDRVLNGRVPTIDDIPNLKYTEHVLAESMRLFPPAWAIGRQAVEDHELGGFKIAKGSTVLMSPFILQHDARFWDDADKFTPERWETQSVKEAGNRNIYFPFGGGIRRCIGESFAWSEGIWVLATMARKWKLRLDPNQKIGTKSLITLRPKFGMRMECQNRER
ncbi:MAG TPA: cytochrome P450 [Pyrinomonadaceae bacterium]|nr:cytochrome P450 [Pyrinomonadaceae bacterium]